MQVSATDPLNPPPGASDIVTVPELPAAMLTVPAEGVITNAVATVSTCPALVDALNAPFAA